MPGEPTDRENIAVPPRHVPLTPYAATQPPKLGESGQNQVLEWRNGYDMDTHDVLVGNLAYPVRSAAGADYYGLKVISWADGLYEISLIDL